MKISITAEELKRELIRQVIERRLARVERNGDVLDFIFEIDNPIDFRWRKMVNA